MDIKKVLSKMKKLSVVCRHDCTFSQLTTLGCGGKIDLTIFPQSKRQLLGAVRYLAKNKIPFCLVGNGSNILAGDGIFHGVAICTKNAKDLSVKGNVITANCGVATAKIAQICKCHGLTNGEFLACLPATIGGAVCCNAGCFGQSAKDIVKSVTVFADGKLKKLTNEQCCFSHRDSIFKNSRILLLQVELIFDISTPQAVAHKISQFKYQKAKTQPLNVKSAGCALYHPTVAVSKLTDELGLKGYQIGQAKISKKHAGFVVNIDKATSKDIYLLVRYIQKRIWDSYQLRTSLELCLINFSED